MKGQSRLAPGEVVVRDTPRRERKPWLSDASDLRVDQFWPRAGGTLCLSPSFFFRLRAVGKGEEFEIAGRW